MNKKVFKPSTRNELLSHLVSISKEFGCHGIERFSAAAICKELIISRNLASQYLNELAKEGIAVKILTRPVYFVHKKALEQRFGKKLDATEFPSASALMRALMPGQTDQTGFERAIGHDASLRAAVEQCKSAIWYPPNGLPVLLRGAPGTGKSFFAGLMQAYAAAKDITQAGSTLLVVDCEQYRNNLDGFLALFATGGLLEKGCSGLLLFDKVQLLPERAQEEFWGRFDAFHAGRQQKGLPSPRVVFTASDEPGSPQALLEKPFLRRIPIVITLPLLKDRSAIEKSDLIRTFFDEEAIRIGVEELSVSHQAYNAFLRCQFPENLTQLKNDIRQSLASAFMRQEGKPGHLVVQLFDLPEAEIAACDVQCGVSEQPEPPVSIGGAPFSMPQDHFLRFATTLAGQNSCGTVLSFQAQLRTWLSAMDEYEDFLTFGGRYVGGKLNAIESVIRQVFDLMEKRSELCLPDRCSYMMARCIYQMYESPVAKDFERQHTGGLENADRVFREHLPQLYNSCAYLMEHLSRNLNLVLGQTLGMILLLLVYQANPSYRAGICTGIVICHGFGTASSIAHTVNKLLDTDVFVPIDLPLGIATNAFERIQRLLQRQFVQEVIVLCDADICDELEPRLQNLSEADVGLVNNVSTKLALEVGTGILEGLPMETNIREACERSAFRYAFSSSSHQRHTIVFAGEGGASAERMMRLFLESMPHHTCIDVMALTYFDLVNPRQRESYLRGRNVLFIAGMLNPNIPGIPFCPLEQIISLTEDPWNRTMFLRFYTGEELELFERNLLKNFSLQNILRHLTILDADHLFSFVERAVERMQRALARPFGAQKSAGLYIHISCLIERLVTRTPIEEYRGMEKLSKENSAFIEAVQQSFTEICQHYGIALPHSEIGYLFDYIYEDYPEYKSILSDF